MINSTFHLALTKQSILYNQQKDTLVKISIFNMLIIQRFQPSLVFVATPVVFDYFEEIVFSQSVSDEGINVVREEYILFYDMNKWSYITLRRQL